MSLSEIIGSVLIGPLKLVFEVIYSFALHFIGSPGLSIIVLSLVMNVLVLPLYRRADAIQMEARDTENRLKDTIAHIKKTFSGDERMMILQTFYRQNNYSPLSVLSSSISLLLQIPFFMAAYQFLSGLEILNGVAFGPITDLSKPDGLLVIGGFAINLLPIIMTLVNVISSSLYLKGFSLKNKIQLYGMAVFFLVFLYNSPAGLVFYWTLNNVFSLVKTIFYRLKHAKTILKVLVGTVGAGLIVSSHWVYGTRAPLFIALLGVAMQLIWVLPLLKGKLPITKETAEAPKPNTMLFVLGGLFLTVLIGLSIPGTYLAASPQEYIDVNYFYHPIWYVVQTVCYTAGLFLVWFGVFYWLANNKGKVIFSRVVWVLSGVMLVNYMFFGTKLGILSPDLKFENDIVFTLAEHLINAAVVIALCVGLYWIAVKFHRQLTSILLIGCIALTGLGGWNLSKVTTATADTLEQFGESENALPSFTLNKNGKNVVVIMLDRAYGPFIPYILEEKPELKKQLDGFTYYANTLSYGAFTNFGTPALYGGYDYTPVNMNLRDTEKLVSKHNEALKVLPSVFAESGAAATTIDPSYADYWWTPKINIFDGMTGVSAYLASGKFDSTEKQLATITARKRNFFFFSLMKTLPVSLQTSLYNKGEYRTLAKSATNTDGVSPEFLKAFNVLKNMNVMTKVADGTQNTFMMLRSNATHEAVILQEPQYEPSSTINNSAYHTADGYKIVTAGDSTLTLKPETASLTHYHVNMASLLQLGKWFDQLRKQGVYDNTRIILVSDHGVALHLFDQTKPVIRNTGYYRPLLMVKDFGATGFTTSNEFMTNADLPTLATDGVVENPVNPFTGNAINSDYKTENASHHVIVSNQWDVTKNNGTQFLPDEWATFSGDTVSDRKNWTFHTDKTVFPPDLKQ